MSARPSKIRPTDPRKTPIRCTLPTNMGVVLSNLWPHFGPWSTLCHLAKLPQGTHQKSWSFRTCQSGVNVNVGKVIFVQHSRFFPGLPILERGERAACCLAFYKGKQGKNKTFLFWYGSPRFTPHTSKCILTLEHQLSAAFWAKAAFGSRMRRRGLSHQNLRRLVGYSCQK